MPNALYYGDNLEVLRKHVTAESVDLIYLDPPFNSNQDYNVLFKEQSGDPAHAQMQAFTDTWVWSEKLFSDFCDTCPNQLLVDLMQGFVKTLGRNDVTAYLVMMAPRLVELHTVLKSTGSLYLHCDPAASHALKLVMDCIFGPMQFGTEIIWKRTNARSTAENWPHLHDTILYYKKSAKFHFQATKILADKAKMPHTLITGSDGLKYQTFELTGPGLTKKGESGKAWRGFDPAAFGRHWANNHAQMEEWAAEGLIHFPKNGGFPRRRDDKPYSHDDRFVTVGDVWTDIDRLNQTAKERLGYPTQKPVALLERILAASSKKGDVVLDPFCGCGTAVVAAQKLRRKWIGIDITHLAIALIKYRLADSFRLKEHKDYDVIGEPTTAEGAQALALQDRDEFQKWAVGLIPRAFPFQTKKGADSGIDGILRFRDDPRADAKRCVIQVKSGKLTLSAVRDFAHVIDRENATLGFFITLEPPSKPMQLAADALGFYTTPLGNRKIARFQIRTVEHLLGGVSFDIPQTAEFTGVKTAENIEPGDEQIGLL